MNFNTWKEKILIILEEHDLDGFVSNVVEDPTTNVGCTSSKKNQSKSKRIVYNLVKDNLMLLVSPLKTTKECFDTLTNLYEKKAPNQKRVLKNKILNLNMEKDETIYSLFTNISQVRDQLMSIRINVNDDDLIQTVVDGIPSSW